jgi:hypothetical protein
LGTIWQLLSPSMRQKSVFVSMMSYRSV